MRGRAALAVCLSAWGIGLLLMPAASFGNRCWYAYQDFGEWGGVGDADYRRGDHVPDRWRSLSGGQSRDLHYDSRGRRGLLLGH